MGPRGTKSMSKTPGTKSGWARHTEFMQLWSRPVPLQRIPTRSACVRASCGCNVLPSIASVRLCLLASPLF